MFRLDLRRPHTGFNQQGLASTAYIVACTGPPSHELNYTTLIMNWQNEVANGFTRHTLSAAGRAVFRAQRLLMAFPAYLLPIAFVPTLRSSTPRAGFELPQRAPCATG